LAINGILSCKFRLGEIDRELLSAKTTLKNLTAGVDDAEKKDDDDDDDNGKQL
jgi:hypothetical protein